MTRKLYLPPELARTERCHKIIHLSEIIRLIDAFDLYVPTNQDLFPIKLSLLNRRDRRYAFRLGRYDPSGTVTIRITTTLPLLVKIRCHNQFIAITDTSLFSISLTHGLNPTTPLITVVPIATVRTDIY